MFYIGGETMIKRTNLRFVKSLNDLNNISNTKVEPVVFTYDFESFSDLKMLQHKNMIDAIRYAIENRSTIIKDGEEIEYGVLNDDDAFYILNDNINIVKVGE